MSTIYIYIHYHPLLFRIFGLKSGKCLKEMRGHTSFVTDVRYTEENHQAVGGGVNFRIRIYIWGRGVSLVISDL